MVEKKAASPLSGPYMLTYDCLQSFRHSYKSLEHHLEGYLNFFWQRTNNTTDHFIPPAHVHVHGRGIGSEVTRAAMGAPLFGQTKPHPLNY